MSLFVVTRFSGSRRAAAPLVNRDREGAGTTFTRSLTVAVHQKPSGHAAHADPLKRVTTNKSAKRAASKSLHNKRLFECYALRAPKCHSIRILYRRPYMSRSVEVILSLSHSQRFPMCRSLFAIL